MSCQDNCAQCRAYPCTCAMNFWILPSGTNLLKGCECDPENPIRLQDCFIIWAIEHSAVARRHFDVLYESLFPCEKERFTLLFGDNPMLSRLVTDVTTKDDTFQRKFNQTPVYTAGKFGARRLPVGRVSQLLQLPPNLAPRVQPRRCGSS